MRNTIAVCAVVLLLVTGIAHADGGNASNPLAVVNNTDLRLQYFDLDGLFGIGSDKPYDWGVGVGVRFSY